MIIIEKLMRRRLISLVQVQCALTKIAITLKGPNQFLRSIYIIGIKATKLPIYINYFEPNNQKKLKF